MRILRELLRKLRHTTMLARGIVFGDQVTLRDRLTIVLKKDGEIIKQWTEIANTWVAAGKTAIRDALADGGFTKISYMYMTASTGAAERPTTNSKPASDKARFIATWPAAGAITGITAFHIRQTSGGSYMATISVSSFNKPDGIELEITWDTTVS